MPQRQLPIIKDQSDQHQNQLALFDPALWSDYITSADPMTVLVQVKDPTNEGIGRGLFTSYNVVTEQAAVRRRYSDFQWLYGRLQTEVPGAIVPIIPHRRAITSDTKFSEEFVEGRRGNLEKFVQAVLQHEELKNAPSMTPFMTAEIGEDFDTAKQAVEKTNPSTHVPRQDDDEEATAASTVGKKVGNFLAKANTLMQVRTGHVEIEQTKEDPEINVIKDYVAEVEMHAKYLLAASQALVKTTMDKSNAIHDLGIPIAGWKSTHQNSLKHNKDAFTEMASAMIEFSDECTNLFEEQHKHEKEEFEQVMNKLLLDVQAFNVALKKRRSLQVSYTTKLKQIHDKAAAIDKAKTALKPPEVAERLTAEKAGLEREAVPFKAVLDECSVRLIREASRAQPSLGVTLKECILTYAQLQIKYNTKMNEAWSKLMPQLMNEPSTTNTAPSSSAHVIDSDPEDEETEESVRLEEQAEAEKEDEAEPEKEEEITMEPYVEPNVEQI